MATGLMSGAGACALAWAVALWAAPSSAQTFEGKVVATWLRDGRQMELMQPFSFVDGAGRRWHVPKGARVDGASIPRVLWSAVGAPYSGKYRQASVVHDYFCDTMLRPWEQVHRMFYEATVAEGNGETLSKVMYAAVYRWGPRWRYINGKPTRLRQFSPSATSGELNRIEAWIRDKNPSPEEIAARLGKPPG